MNKVAIITDSNSGITPAEAARLGITVLPMPFFIDDQLYYEELTLSLEQFYRFMSQGADIKTSQPAVGDVLELWERTLRDYETVVHIPMSSGLSGTCATAKLLAADFGGRVRVVDNKRISWSQKQSVLEALELARLGYSANEIGDILERSAMDVRIYIAVDTLKYLKKGGRITPAAAALGSVLNIKPVLQIFGDKLDAYAKVRGTKHAHQALLNAVQKDLDAGLGGAQPYIRAAHTCSDDQAQAWKEEIEAHFPEAQVHMDRLSLSTACHIGPGAVGILWEKSLAETGWLAYPPPAVEKA